MIRVLIPKDKEFTKYKQECKKLYKSVQSKICDTNSFEFIINNTFFYMFLDNDTFTGVLYFFLDEENKMYVNGFGKRKYFLHHLECVKLALNWFKCDIYAEAQNRASALCLLKCGFKRKNKNIFVRIKNCTSDRKRILYGL